MLARQTGENISSTEELNLVKRSVNGDREAFATLLQQVYPRIYRMAWRWCGGQKADAEDIAQESCVHIGRSIQDFRMECAFTSWVYRIVMNTAYDMQRKKRYHLDMDEAVTVAGSGQQDIEENLEHHRLWQQVRRLPDKQRDAILLVYAEELSHAEAAIIMECKESTISWYVHEARKQLAQWMNADE